MTGGLCNALSLLGIRFLSLPVGRKPFGTRFSGPYIVVRKVGACNYVIGTPERRQKTRLCHINLLKGYVEWDPANPVGCVTVPLSARESEEEGSTPESVDAWLYNSRECEQLQKSLTHLTEAQAQDVMALVSDHPSLVRDRLGLMSLVSMMWILVWRLLLNNIRIGCLLVRRRFIRRYILEIGAIEPGSGEWSSPVVLIPKSDGTSRLCVDYRKVNAVTKTDAYPIHRIEDCIDRIGQAKFVTKLDLLKGYWQVPLSEWARDFSAFATHDALYRCRVFAFWHEERPRYFSAAYEFGHGWFGSCGDVY